MHLGIGPLLMLRGAFMVKFVSVNRIGKHLTLGAAIGQRLKVVRESDPYLGSPYRTFCGSEQCVISIAALVSSGLIRPLHFKFLMHVSEEAGTEIL